MLGCVQTASQNPIFSQPRLEPDGSYEVINHMKYDFCKPDHHLWEVVSNRIWTDVSESEQLQTLKSVLTVRDVSLRYSMSLYVTPDPHLFQLLLLADINGGNGGCRKHQSLDRQNQILN